MDNLGVTIPLPGHQFKCVVAIPDGDSGTDFSKIFTFPARSGFLPVQFTAVGAATVEANLQSSQDAGDTWDTVQPFVFTTQRTQQTNLTPGVLYRFDVTTNTGDPTDIYVSYGV